MDKERKVPVSVTLTINNLEKIDKKIKDGDEKSLSQYIRRLIDEDNQIP